MTIRRVPALTVLMIVALTVVGCGGGKKPPVARPLDPAAGKSDPGAAGSGTLAPRERVRESTIPREPRVEDPLKVSDIDKINQNSPFQPVFFAYDSSEIDAAGQQTLNANAAVLKKYPEWVITIEGHSDERGTAEYNLALGNRRATAAKAYLISLGIPADRLRTVSY